MRNTPRVSLSLAPALTAGTVALLLASSLLAFQALAQQSRGPAGRKLLPIAAKIPPMFSWGMVQFSPTYAEPSWFPPIPPTQLGDGSIPTYIR